MFYVERHGGAAVIYTEQELDLVSRDAFADILEVTAADATGPVVVSLERCSYVDSTALNVLIGARKRIGPRLSVVVPHGNRCRRIFDICGLDGFLGITASVDEAVARVLA